MEYLKRFLLWFITGFAVVCGGTAGMLAVDQVSVFLKGSRESGADGSKMLVIQDVKPIQITTAAAVSGRAINPSKDPITSIRLQLVLVHEGKVLFKCDERAWLDPMQPAQEQAFQIVCKEVARANLPAGVEYKVEVVDAVVSDRT